MIELRPFAKLGGADHGWLKAKHHFSFGSHYDPENMGHGSLRVWNDDEIAPNTGFPAHPHANMEIITYVREGAITHQDSLGNKGRTEAGDVQVMSAGSGIRHSEYNLEPSKTKIFQIWIEPTTQGGQPTWGAKPFPKSDRSGKFVTIASGFKADNDALPIRADARVLATTLKAGESAEYAPDKTRNLYLVPAAGSVEINGVRVNARDGVAIRDEAKLEITALEDSELVLVDARQRNSERRHAGLDRASIPSHRERTWMAGSSAKTPRAFNKTFKPKESHHGQSTVLYSPTVTRGDGESVAERRASRRHRRHQARAGLVPAVAKARIVSSIRQPDRKIGSCELRRRRRRHRHALWPNGVADGELPRPGRRRLRVPCTQGRRRLYRDRDPAWRLKPRCSRSSPISCISA